MKHHDRLFGLARAFRQGEENAAPADRSRNKRDHARRLIGISSAVKSSIPHQPPHCRW